MGTNPYGVMIVAGPEGFRKAAYRKFAIRGPIAPGDDFAMMREVLQRRFTRALKEQEEGAPATDWPDVVLIDGGAGQLSAARDVLTDLGVQDVKLVAIAKGPDRDAGREWFHTDGMAPFQLPPRDPVLYFLQRLRDEAHRFAITTHRAGRSKNIRQSELDEIPGIGAARKRALLNHFGSARGVKMAGLARPGGGARASATKPRGACTRISIRGCGWRARRSYDQGLPRYRRAAPSETKPTPSKNRLAGSGVR